MLSESELAEEAEGSKRDVAAACSRVEYQLHHHHEPWMGDATVQITFTLTVRSDSTDNDSKDTALHNHYVGLELPRGWIALTNIDGQYQRLSGDIGNDHYSATLNGLMMRIAPQYKANKDQELFDRLQLLASAARSSDTDSEDD